VERLETAGGSAETDLMRPPQEKGRRMLALYLVLAIPGVVVWFSSESLVAVVAMLPRPACRGGTPNDPLQSAPEKPTD
jgi:hypothetical protein